MTLLTLRTLLLVSTLTTFANADNNYTRHTSDAFFDKHKGQITLEDFKKLLAGNFGEKIGNGAYGEVRKVPWKDKTNHTEFIAIKVIDSNNYGFSRTDIEREAWYLRHFSENSITQFPKFYGCFEHNKKFYLVMELLMGSLSPNKKSDKKNLNHIYAQFRDLNIKSRVYAYAQLASAIEFMHTEGHVHHDIKPENIGVKWLGELPRLNLIDFGIARKSSQNPMKGTGFYSDRKKLYDLFPDLFKKPISEADNQIENHQFADLYAFVISIYVIENSPNFKDIYKHAFPAKFHRDLEQAIKHRAKKIVDTEWMHEPYLKKSFPYESGSVCFKDIIKEIMNSSRSNVTETAGSFAKKLTAFYEFLLHVEEKKIPNQTKTQKTQSEEKPGLLSRIKNAVLDFFGCASNNDVDEPRKINLLMRII